jgi:hypothetical protein
VATSEQRKQEILRRYAAGQSVRQISRALLVGQKAVEHAITKDQIKSRKHCGATVDEVVEDQGCGHCVACQAIRLRYAPEIARRRAARAIRIQRGERDPNAPSPVSTRRN